MAHILDYVYMQVLVVKSFYTPLMYVAQFVFMSVMH